ncbi:hypothetical protein D3C72_2365270 [compost metagenome]
MYGFGKPAQDFCCEARPAIDHASIKLHEIGTSLDLGERCFGAVDTAHADQRHVRADTFAHTGQNDGRTLEKRCAGKPTGFFAVLSAFQAST